MENMHMINTATMPPNIIPDTKPYRKSATNTPTFYIPKLSLADVSLAALYKSLYEYLKASIVCEKS